MTTMHYQSCFGRVLLFSGYISFVLPQKFPVQHFWTLAIQKQKKKTLNDMNISCMIEKHLGAEKYWLIMPVAWISCFSLALKSNWWGSSWLFFRTNLEKKLWFDFNILVSLYVSYFYQDLFYRCLLISIIGRHSTLSYYYWLK